MRFIVVTLLLLSACGTRELKIDLSPTYTDINRIIIQPKCVSCHASLGTYNGLREIVRAGDAERSSLYEVIAEGDMPPQPPALTTKEIAAIREWINTGAAQ